MQARLLSDVINRSRNRLSSPSVFYCKAAAVYDIMPCILTHVMHIVKFAIATSLAINVFLLLYYMFTSCTVGIFITMILIIFQYPKVDGQSYVIFICMIFLHCIVLLNQNIAPNCKELFLHIPTIVVHLKLLHHLTGTNLQILMCPLSLNFHLVLVIYIYRRSHHFSRYKRC